MIFRSTSLLTDSFFFRWKSVVPYIYSLKILPSNFQCSFMSKTMRGYSSLYHIITMNSLKKSINDILVDYILGVQEMESDTHSCFQPCSCNAKALSNGTDLHDVSYPNLQD